MNLLKPIYISLLLLLTGCSSSSTNDRDNADTGASVSASGEVFQHGEYINVDLDWGSENSISTFLGGALGRIESLSEGDQISGSGRWSFEDTDTFIKADATRGKVLYSQEDNNNYNAVRIFDAGDILEQRHFYAAYWVRNVLLVDGSPYEYSYQWKQNRVSWQPVWSDTSTEIKVHNWPGSQGIITIVNRSSEDGSTYWGGSGADSNSDWALMEMIVYTGSTNEADGRLLTRVHKDGKTQVSHNRMQENIYNSDSHRLRYFIEQNYFGNFAQIEGGVNSDLPRPDTREIYSDDSLIYVGQDLESGKKRVELRDSPDLQTAKVRELQPWVSLNGRVQVTVNTGGLSTGEHRLYLVMINGVDADGWDVVEQAIPVTIRVL